MTSSAPLVLGVCPDQNPEVRLQAASLAKQMGAALLCVWVDPTQYTIARLDDGTVISSPIDPDSDGHCLLEFPSRLFEELHRQFSQLPLDWSTSARAGSVSKELALAAIEHGAKMIVIGAQQPSLKRSLNHLLNGSTAVKLAQQQLCPVLVVPQAGIPPQSETPIL